MVDKLTRTERDQSVERRFVIATILLAILGGAIIVIGCDLDYKDHQIRSLESTIEQYNATQTYINDKLLSEDSAIDYNMNILNDNINSINNDMDIHQILANSNMYLECDNNSYIEYCNHNLSMCQIVCHEGYKIMNDVLPDMSTIPVPLPTIHYTNSSNIYSNQDLTNTPNIESGSAGTITEVNINGN